MRTALGLLFALGAAALPSPSESDLVPRAACSGNTAADRSVWCDWSVDDNYYETGPDTGNTREYWLSLEEGTLAPDGVSRSVMTINGTIPGPTIFADWGDTLKIHVTNNLQSSTNGTSIHWHGIRQNYTNDNDGVASITQCPTAPGETLTYTWKATQYGSSWYHSHFSLQAWEGVFGGIVINGPATADYDVDLGPLFVTDWHHRTVDEEWPNVRANGPIDLDTALINGTNIWEDGGEHFTLGVTSGKSYRIRLVNSALDSHFKFSIDNHTLTVMSSDFVPVVPYETEIVTLGIGQRYDLIVTANQDAVASNFWMRAIPQTACSAQNSMYNNTLGIVYYGDEPDTPETTGWAFLDGCDEETANLVPNVPITVDAPYWYDREDVTVGPGDDGFNHWKFNNSAMSVKWADPTIEKVINGTDVFDTQENVIALSETDKWAYLVIDTTFGVSHPIHLHGHDFFILAQESSAYSPSTVVLNLDNPPRRDVAMLPASGYLVIAFTTDNPGVWLMHCHIGWHTSEGLDLQFVERFSEIADVVNQQSIGDTCDTWTDWQADKAMIETDSGV